MITDINEKNIRVIFMGTPHISTYALKALLSKQYNVIAIITQPDKPLGRKKILTPSPIKVLASKLNIKVFQPNKIKDIENEIKLLDPDLLVTCAYGQFIPNSILDIPKYGCINAHASLLPKYRGGAPIHWSLINGEKTTGVTLLKSIKEMDAGDMFIAYSLSISCDDNLTTLFEKMGKAIFLIIRNELIKILNGSLKPIKQKEELVSWAFNIKKEQEKINLNDNVKNIVNWVRGLYENPTGYVIFENNLKVKLFHVEQTNVYSTLEPGTIVGVSKNGIEITTKDFNLLIKEFQVEGKKRINIKDFYKGNRLFLVNKKFS